MYDSVFVVCVIHLSFIAGFTLICGSSHFFFYIAGKTALLRRAGQERSSIANKVSLKNFLLPYKPHLSRIVSETSASLSGDLPKKKEEVGRNKKETCSSKCRSAYSRKMREEV